MDFKHIRKASNADVGEIALLFKCVTDAMIETGLDQWDYTYPLAEHIQKDVDDESCYVWAEDGKIGGTITVDTNQDEQYGRINWAWPSVNVLVIHRLAVHPLFQGRGISKSLCIFVEAIARSRNLEAIRLDAYSINQVSNKLYDRLGYQKANGYCYFRDLKAPFYCYEKKL